MHSWGRGPVFIGGPWVVQVRWGEAAKVGGTVCSGNKVRVAELAVSHAMETCVRQSWSQV